MKPLALALLATLAAFATSGARADHSRVNVDVGITIGSARSVPVYVEPAPVVVAPVGYRHAAPARGYWENVTVKTWVPGRWVHSYDGRGRPHRFFEKGYYAYHTERVWVEAGRGHRNRDYKHAYNGGHRHWNR
jgi:hypothetical protein